MADDEFILITGATGYIGGRLAPRLLARGRRVRCVVRDAGKISDRDWVADPRVEIVEADVGNPERMAAALEGCSAAYYLVHSMIAAKADYRVRDRELAASFASAAARAGVKRIVYLGGLGELGRELSPHLASRREVEEVLAAGPVPVTVLRAAMIIGSGSASFEILRYLVERLPIMITPRWVSTPSQPIAVEDALESLMACLENPSTVGQTLDVGGPEVLRYEEIIQQMAQSLGLRKRVIVPVPVLTPRLSSLWIHLVTPLASDIARPLAEGLRNPVVCRTNAAAELVPRRLRTVREAIDAAVRSTRSEDAETTWFDAGPVPGDPEWAGGARFDDRRTLTIGASPSNVYRAVCRVGGRQGWYSGSWLWKLRGAIDRVLGGPGLGRGRRRRDRILYGDVVDFWRVSAVEENRLLELRAEMKLPGQASLRFEIEPRGAEGAQLVQQAVFRPRGLAGLLYWWAVLPVHGFVFDRMLRGVGEAAEEIQRTGQTRAEAPGDPDHRADPDQ